MLSFVDVIIIVIYLLITITVGIMCRGKQEDADDYFTTKGTMGGFFSSILVGLSIAATLFSGISFLAYPSVVYSNGIGILLGLLNFFLAWLVLIHWFLPKYLGNDKTKHPYDIIEQKLGPEIRTLAASMYVLLRIGWMAALIYAPTIAIMAATGLEGPLWFWIIVLTIGLASTVYTVLGGIRGVIVTDAMQFLVIVIGLTFTIFIVIYRLPVSFSEVFAFLKDSGRLKLLDFSIDPVKPITFWSVLIGVNIANLSAYMADQMSLQRYLATGSIQSVSRSFVANILGVVIVLCLLCFVGLTLFAWYHYYPDKNLPESVDKIFPYFVATQLPPGAAGLILAAILAATMSSMTSGINTLSATLCMDFRTRFGKPLSPKQQLEFGRKISMVIGLAATLAAGIVNALGNIFEMTQALLGLFLGPILACMFFALIKWAVSRASLVVGVFVGLIAGCIVTYSLIANTWVPAVTFFVSIFVTFAGSMFFTKSKSKINTKQDFNL